MLRKALITTIACVFLASCASDYEAEKAVTRAEMADAQQVAQMQQERRQEQEKFSGELRPVYFETSSAKLTDRFKRRLDLNVKSLKENKDFQVYITGHADQRGDEAYNWELAMKRAKAVEDYMVNKGISRDRIYTISKGENAPKVSASDESYYQINRRVEFEPFKAQGALAE